VRRARVGAPIFFGALHKDAKAFLERDWKAPESHPIAVFAPRPTSAAEDVECSRSQSDTALAKVSWFLPAGGSVRGGRRSHQATFRNKAPAALPARYDAWAAGYRRP